MICIICRSQNKEMSEEHIVAQFLGGTLKTSDVCVDCNSRAGIKIDSILCRNIMIMLRVEREKGSVQNFKNLFKTARLTEQPSQPISVTRKNNKLEIILHPHREDCKNESGKEELVTFITDVRAEKKLKDMGDKFLKRKGKLPLTCEEFNEKVQYQLIPTGVTLSLEDNSAQIGIVLAKMAYEFTCLKLGKPYLYDPLGKIYAKELLDCIMNKRAYEKIIFPGFFFSMENFPEFFSEGNERHEIRLVKEDSFIYCSVKIFNIYGGLFPMTISPEIYNLKEDISYIEE